MSRKTLKSGTLSETRLRHAASASQYVYFVIRRISLTRNIICMQYYPHFSSSRPSGLITRL
jgi:hypothetical protein